MTANQRDEYPQIITWAEVIHVVEGPVVDEAAIRRATEVHHAYRIRNTGESPFQAEGEVVVTGPYRRPDIIG